MRDYYLAILNGSLLTVGVSLASLAVATLLGLMGAAAKLSGRRPLVWLAQLYTTVVRAVPELVLILLLYYAGTDAVNQLLGLFNYGPVDINGLVAGIFVIGVVQGAYSTEVLRGAIKAVPPGQIEAARAFGMSPLTLFVHIRLPLMWRYALPALGNIWISLIKNTSLISVVGLEELMRVSYIATSVTRSPFHFYMLAALIYLLLTIANSLIIEWLETRANRGVRRV